MGISRLAFSISLGISLLIGSLSFYYERSWQTPVLLFLIVLLLLYLIISYLIERFVYERIKVIYKLIHNLKLGKNLKGALGKQVSQDPLSDAEQQVRDWATTKTQEIAQLKEQEKFRREFLSNISHEFKTPLFSIQAYIETLQDGMLEEDIEMAQSFLQKASKNIDRLAYLIGDLDDISRLESGKFELEFSKFDVIGLIKESMDLMEKKAEQNQIKLIPRFNLHTPVYVQADKNRIQQVLTNLIDNSIKYGTKGGTTKIYVFQLLEQILIEVTDDGQGIEEKNLSRIFERLYRVDKDRSRTIGGSGLGLAIVKHIVEAHNQNVHARSTVNIGTTVGFTLKKASH